MKLLVCYGRQAVAVNVNCQVQCLYNLVLFVKYLYLCGVLSCLGIAWNLDCSSYGACFHCVDCLGLVLFYYIGN